MYTSADYILINSLSDLLQKSVNKNYDMLTESYQDGIREVYITLCCTKEHGWVFTFNQRHSKEAPVTRHERNGELYFLDSLLVNLNDLLSINYASSMNYGKLFVDLYLNKSK